MTAWNTEWSMDMIGPFAVVLERQGDLAETLRESLAGLGFEAVIATSHMRAAALSEGRCPQLLIASGTAPGQNDSGAFLESCRDMLGSLPTVLLLSDPWELVEHAPEDAVRLLKPFTMAELMLAVDAALTLGQHSLMD